MTRYTNLGKKRTYLEAGFDHDEPTASQPHGQREPAPNPPPATTPAAAPATESNDTSGSQPAANSSAPQPRKHRRRHRSKKGKGLPPPVKKTKTAESSNTAGPVEGGDTAEGDRPPSGEPPQKKAKKPRIRQPKDGSVRDPERDLQRRQQRQEVRDRREARRLKRIEEKNAGTTCFVCREKGHAARDCPKASEIAGPDSGSGNVVGICYRCGSQKHTLSRCRTPADPENPFPFASCFVCSGKGHLAGSCPQNQNKGVYPNGGSCKICGGTTHLAKDCTVRKDEVAAKAVIGSGFGAGADEDDFMVLKRRAKEVEKQEHVEERWKHVLEVSEQAPARLTQKLSAPAKKKVVVF